MHLNVVSITCVEWENESLRREAIRKEITNEQWICLQFVRITCVELASAADVSQSGEGNINSD